MYVYSISSAAISVAAAAASRLGEGTLSGCVRFDRVTIAVEGWIPHNTCCGDCMVVIRCTCDELPIRLVDECSPEHSNHIALSRMYRMPLPPFTE